MFPFFFFFSVYRLLFSVYCFFPFFFACTFTCTLDFFSFFSFSFFSFFEAYRSRAMLPCCDFTSSDDDEHNTDTNFLLLFTDVVITPTLLEGLTEVDALHTALGCRFTLDIFTISQQHSPTPDHEPLLHDPEFATL